jgi:hypothetical protein
MGEAVISVENTIVGVDRPYFPPYPGYLGRPIHPRMWCMGPTEYDLAKIVRWRHPVQERGGQISVEDIYLTHLHADVQKKILLENCFNLQDDKAVRGKGIETFRGVFKEGESLLLLKSAIKSPGASIFHVPCLSEYGGELRTDWLMSIFQVGPSVITPHYPVRQKR